MDFTMMYQKPKHHKQKSQHISNERITEIIECEICHERNATEFHELRGGKGYRSNCIRIGFQLALCGTCHKAWHETYSKKHKNVIRADKQRQLMDKGLTLKEFTDEIGANYL